MPLMPENRVVKTTKTEITVPVPYTVEHGVWVYENGNELHSLRHPNQGGIYVGDTYDEALAKLQGDLKR